MREQRREPGAPVCPSEERTGQAPARRVAVASGCVPGRVAAGVCLMTIPAAVNFRPMSSIFYTAEQQQLRIRSGRSARGGSVCDAVMELTPHAGVSAAASGRSPPPPPRARPAPHCQGAASRGRGAAPAVLEPGKAPRTRSGARTRP